MKRFLMFVFATAVCAAAQNPRVFVTDSQSWEMRGSSGGSGAGFGGHASGGARPQTAEIIKTFGERCPKVTINNKMEKADYAVVLDHEGGKGFARKDNKVAVFNREGDAILSRSTRSLGNAVQDACEAVMKDWAKRPPLAGDPDAQAKPASATAAELAGSKVHITSQPAGAEIEINGSFVGSTPSTVVLAPGDHVVTIKKSGYKSWERKIKITGGEVNLSAELEKTEG